MEIYLILPWLDPQLSKIFSFESIVLPIYHGLFYVCCLMFLLSSSLTFYHNFLTFLFLSITFFYKAFYLNVVAQLDLHKMWNREI